MRQIIKTLDRRLGMAAYGLPNGFLTNTVARLTLYRARRSHPGDASGFRVPAEPYQQLGNLYDADVITSLQDTAAAAFESDAATEKAVDGAVYQRTIDSHDFAFEDHADLRPVFSPEVRDIIESYLGCYFTVHRIEAFQNFSIPNELQDMGISTFKWHIDLQPPSTVKLFVLLDDVTEADGPTEIADAPPARFSPEDLDPDSRTTVSPDAITRMTGEAGSGYLFAPMRRLHRAGHVADGRKREIILFELSPATEPLPDNWPEQPPYASGRQRETAIGQFQSL